LYRFQDEHKYDLVELVRREKMSFYDRVKFVNYARRMVGA
jgi:hypothetical protein